MTVSAVYHLTAPSPGLLADGLTGAVSHCLNCNFCPSRPQIYWPTERGVAVQRGPLMLTLQSQSPANGRVERIISVLHAETKMSRVVIHLQFSGWPRASLPASPAPLVQFVAEVSPGP